MSLHHVSYSNRHCSAAGIEFIVFKKYSHRTCGSLDRLLVERPVYIWFRKDGFITVRDDLGVIYRDIKEIDLIYPDTDNNEIFAEYRAWKS